MTDERLLISQLHNQATKKSAFTVLVKENQEALYWQIRRMVVNHADADDILQNTFMKAWSGLDSFRGDSKISSWLFRIAVNESLSFLDKKKNAGKAELMDSGIADTLLCDPYFDGDETQAMLQEAINQLPDKQKAVFCMKYFQERRYNEMSEIMGTSIGALKASYHIAVKKITAFFESRD